MDARADHHQEYDSWSEEQCAGIEQAATGVPLVYTYILDPATGSYRLGELCTGFIKVSAPFPVEIELGRI